VIKAELRRLGSLLLRCAEEAAVPAGGALAVDRDLFARRVTEQIAAHPRIRLIREEVTRLPAGPAVIATGPLTAPALAAEIAALVGEEHLVSTTPSRRWSRRITNNMDIAFRASRYGRARTPRGYNNSPMTR